jgi:arsenate reductase
MALTIYQYPKCSTCRKALKWLDANGIEYKSIDIVSAPPSRAALGRALKQSGQGLRALFNTSGESYRAGGYKDKLPSMSEADALRDLSADGKLIKRPLLIGDDQVLVGFDEKAWASALL